MKRLKERAYALLRWSEKYIKTDMVYLAHGGFWLGFGQVIGVILAFASSIFFANLVPKEVYGGYKFIIATVSILASLSLTGMGSVIVQAVARGAEGVFHDAVRTTLRWGLIMLVCAFSAAAYYFFNGNHVLGLSLLIGGSAMLLINSYSLYGNYLVGKKDFRNNTLYNAVNQIITTVVVIITAITTKNVLAIVAAYFISNATLTVIFYKVTISRHHIGNERDTSMMAYSKHLSLMNFFGTLASQADKILLFHFLGATQLAIYAFSQAMPDQFRGAFKNLFGLALPKYASLEEAEMRHSIGKKFVQLTLIAALLIIFYIFAAPYIFHIFFPKYSEAIGYSQIYMLGLITIPGISLFATYFQLKKATAIMYKLNIIGNIATIAITVPLIYKYGILGAVIANGLSWLSLLLVHWRYFAAERSL
jgi:O-antigen/teichoic acid export membrane protein